jgi:hypothetical protein
MATFTMEVPDPLVPRVADAARQQLDLMAVDHSGFTDIQVMRYWTRNSWKTLVSASESKAANADINQSVNDDFNSIPLG